MSSDTGWWRLSATPIGGDGRVVTRTCCERSMVAIWRDGTLHVGKGQVSAPCPSLDDLATVLEQVTAEHGRPECPWGCDHR